MITVEARTLAGPKHSGQFGGAAPDALIALLHALASLHDEHGRRGRARACGARNGPAPRTATTSSASSPRSSPACPFFGTGGLGERIWTGPAVTVTGMDVLPGRQGGQRRRAVRARQGEPARPSRSRIRSRRSASLVDFLEGLHPFGVSLTRRPRRRARGSPRRRPGRVHGSARRARERLGRRDGDASHRAGRSRSSTRSRRRCRRAEMLLLGTTDGFANIHAPNERVLLDEFEKAVLAEAEFFGRYAAIAAGSRSRCVSADARSLRRARSTASWSGCSTGSSASATRCPIRRSCS